MGVVKEDNPYEASALPPVVMLNNTSVTFSLRALWHSLVVMLPWPVLGIAASLGLSLFENSSDAIIMFGGATMFLLLPLGFVVSSEWIFWCADRSGMVVCSCPAASFRKKVLTSQTLSTTSASLPIGFLGDPSWAWVSADHGKAVLKALLSSKYE